MFEEFQFIFSAHSSEEAEMSFKEKKKQTRLFSDLTSEPEGHLKSISYLREVQISSKKTSIFESIQKIFTPKAKTGKRKSTNDFGINFLSNLDHNSKIDKEFKQYLYLKENGYEALANKLEQHDEYPWDEIKTLHCPILMEQLNDLQDVCRAKNTLNKNKANDKLIKLGLSIAHLAIETSDVKDTSESRLVVNDAVVILGKLIYLANQNTLEIAKEINGNKLTVNLDKIEKMFSESTETIIRSLKQHYNEHEESLLQPADAAMKTMTSVEMAKALVSDSGSINIGIISILCTILKSRSASFNSESGLTQTLKYFQHSPKARSDFSKICRPDNTSMPSNDIIRYTLGLPYNTAITDTHAKQTAMAGLLSHLRQGHSGSCFATSIAINIISSRLDLCLKDFTQLLKESQLTRTIKNKVVDFPFLVEMSHEYLEKQFKIDSQGIIYCDNKKGGFIWNVPGIKAACQAIGIDEPKTVLQSLLENKSLFIFPHATTSKDLIKQLIHASSCDKKIKGVLYSRACYAFGSQTINPMLPIWENAIAGMAEAEESSMLKSASVDATHRTVKEYLASQEQLPTDIKEDVIKKFQAELFQRTNFLYDPSLIHVTASKDLKSKEGGFVVYDIPPLSQQKITDVICVDSSEEYRLFLKRILLTIEITSAEMKKVVDYLYQVISSEEFVLSAMQKYHTSNEKIKSLETEEKKAKFTPWKTLGGNDSKKVLDIYLETQNPIQTESFFPKTAEDLIIKFIDLAKNMPSKKKQEFLDNPNKLTPIRVLGNHTFSLMLGHLTLAKAWMNTGNTKEWVEEVISKQSLLIANSKIDQNLSDALIKQTLFEIVPEEFSIKFIDASKNISKSLTIKEFRAAILEICSGLCPKSQESGERQARQFDAALYKELPTYLRKDINASAVHFADTNWSSSSGHDINLCFVVNPGTGKLEIWESYSDGSHLAPLDQKNWLNHQEWEVFHPNIT